jgi:hypothetical protein
MTACTAHTPLVAQSGGALLKTAHFSRTSWHHTLGDIADRFGRYAPDVFFSDVNGWINERIEGRIFYFYAFLLFFLRCVH